MSPTTPPTTTTSAVRYRPLPSCRLTELPDETGVILHLDKKFYFTLNAVAVVVWKRLATDHTAAALAAHLSETFDVDDATALTDVQALLDELVREGMVATEAAGTSP